MNLQPADQEFEKSLSSTVPDRIFKFVEPRYLEEPRALWAGQGGLLALPETTQQVSNLIKAAYQASVGVVPYGGGTGLVGGQIYPDGPAPLIISLERMSHIREVYTSENGGIAIITISYQVSKPWFHAV